jgi:hypothetical protein
MVFIPTAFYFPFVPQKQQLCNLYFHQNGELLNFESLNNLKFRKMKTRNFFLVAILVLTTGLMAFSQKKSNVNVTGLLKAGTLPQNLELKDELQKYVVTTDHFNIDIFGNFFNKMRVKGEYTRGLENGKVKWNNCSVAMAMTLDAEFPAGAPIGYMENFSYNVTENMLNAEAFASFGENSPFAKNLIWDMMAIEGFGWSAWDKLKLNEPYSAKNFNGKMDLAGQGSFENKDVRITWTGISQRNGEQCAVIEYLTMNNPIENICCFLVEERSTFLKTKQDKTYDLDYSLEHLQNMVDPSLFFRINRNYLVNINCIDEIISYSTNRLKLKLGKTELIVSREKVTEFKFWMDR